MYEWDEQKRLSNIEKHGIDFRVAVALFETPHLTYLADHETEERFVTVGMYQERLLTVIWTERGQRKRIISVRRARHAERRDYQDIFS